MWGLFVFAPRFAAHVQPWLTDHLGNWPLIGALFQGPPMGIGMLTAGLILAIMIIPFMAAVMRDVFETVPGARCASRPTRSAARPGRWFGASCCRTRASA